MTEFWSNYSKSLMYFKVDRFFSYQYINSLNIYEHKEQHINENLNGVSKENLKDWFIRCEMFNDKDYTKEIDKKT